MLPLEIQQIPESPIAIFKEYTGIRHTRKRPSQSGVEVAADLRNKYEMEGFASTNVNGLTLIFGEQEKGLMSFMVLDTISKRMSPGAFRFARHVASQVGVPRDTPEETENRFVRWTWRTRLPE